MTVLEMYNQKHKFAVIATDVAILTVKDKQLNVLLMKKDREPYEGYWAIPGGLVRPDEDLNHSARRHLADTLKNTGVFMEQLYTFGDVPRDPSGRVVSVAYFALIHHEMIHLKTHGIVAVPLKALPQMAYDHKTIVRCALERLQIKIEYTNIVHNLLPEEFTLTELQETYEIILDRELDKRNFRKRIQALNIIEKTGNKTRGVAHRPAMLYRFVLKVPQAAHLLK